MYKMQKYWKNDEDIHYIYIKNLFAIFINMYFLE